MSINANGVDIVRQTALLLNHSWVPRRGVLQPVVDIFKSQLQGLNATVVCAPVLDRFTISRFQAAANDHYLPVIKLLETAADNVRDIEC